MAERESLIDARDQDETPSSENDDVRRLVNAARLLVDSYDATLGRSFWNAYDDLSNALPRVERHF